MKLSSRRQNSSNYPFNNLLLISATTNFYVNLDKNDTRKGCGAGVCHLTLVVIWVFLFWAYRTPNLSVSQHASVKWASMLLLWWCGICFFHLILTSNLICCPASDSIFCLCGVSWRNTFKLTLSIACENMWWYFESVTLNRVHVCQLKRWVVSQQLFVGS